MKILLLLFFSILPVGAQNEWKSLFDGKTLTGWKSTSEANFLLVNGAILVDCGPKGLLIHEGSYTDYTAEKPSSGNRIGLQKNEGRVAFRNVRVRKL